MTKHTPEPWRVGDPATCVWEQRNQGIDDSGKVIFSCNQNFYEEAIIDASRIVACVNACAGIETEKLESNPGGVLMIAQNTNLSRIAELEAMIDAERERHGKEIEAWERVHSAMIDERDAERAKVGMLKHLLALVEDDIREAHTLGLVREAIAATIPTDPPNGGLLGAPLQGLSDIDEAK